MPGLEQMPLALVLAIASAVSIGLVYGIHVLAAFVRGKTHNQAVGYILTVVENLASKVVAEVYQSYVEPLKMAGTWDDQSKKIAFDKAMSALESYLGLDGLAKVAGVLGNGADTTKFLATYLESAVKDAKPPLLASLEPIPEPLPGVVLAPSSNPN